TAHLVKPVNRDDLPDMRGIDGLKNGSPLGVEPKGEGIDGKTGHSVTGQSSEGTTTDTQKVTTSDSTVSLVSPSSRAVNGPLPVARAIPSHFDVNLELVKPR
ncbi:MAG TPA: hypothetical protein VMM84_03295, partial [Pyrinomonadaceae bacterium]|nr:hypothetical protein [Pyrinomonadaceae bacterium]